MSDEVLADHFTIRHGGLDLNQQKTVILSHFLLHGETLPQATLASQRPLWHPLALNLQREWLREFLEAANVPMATIEQKLAQIADTAESLAPICGYKDVVNANYNSDLLQPPTSDDDTEGPPGPGDDESSGFSGVDSDTETDETSGGEDDVKQEEDEDATRNKLKRPLPLPPSPIAKRLRKRFKGTVPPLVPPPLNHVKEGKTKKKTKVITHPPASPSSQPDVNTKKKKPIRKQRLRFQECNHLLLRGPSQRDDLAPAGHYDRTTFNKRNKF